MSLVGDSLLYWAAGAFIALAVPAIEAQRMRLDPWSMYLAGIFGLCGALIGGELFVSIVPDDPAASGGRAAMGAFAGACAVGWFVLRLRSADFLRYTDAAIPGIALGYAIYRIGCFLNGCCFGSPTDLPWGVAFGPSTEAFSAQVAAGWIASDATRTLPVHPTQLYHAAFGLATFLATSGRRPAYAGDRLTLALALYGTGRFAVEFLRADTPPLLGPLNVNHLASLLMLALAFVLWSVLKPAGPRPLPPAQPA